MNIINYLKNRFCKFVVLNREASTISFSRALFNAILKEEQKKNPSVKAFNVSFWKLRDSDEKLVYTMWVNPNWNNHGVSNPNMVFQTPILMDPNDHVSIKACMPTVDEILSIYEIQGEIVRLKVEIARMNGEQYYTLNRDSYDLKKE